jgi:hypothetical protein
MNENLSRAQYVAQHPQTDRETPRRNLRSAFDEVSNGGRGEVSSPVLRPQNLRDTAEDGALDGRQSPVFSPPRAPSVDGAATRLREHSANDREGSSDEDGASDEETATTRPPVHHASRREGSDEEEEGLDEIESRGNRFTSDDELEQDD